MRLLSKTCILSLVLFASACSYTGVLDPHGPVGAAERTILFNATVIMLAVVVPVILGTVLFAWWFRAGNRKARRQLELAYAGRVEFVVWSIPALVVLFLGGIGWISSHALDPGTRLPGAKAPIEIEVVSLDWKWLFIYPDLRVASLNHLVVPVGAPLHFRLTSAGVMNSFFIPQLGSQIYTMAGMATELNLQADDAGTFAGLSAQFSGDGFSDMQFDVAAVTPQAFAQWLEETRTHGGALGAPEYAQLTRPSSKDAPRTFAPVSPMQFEAILADPGAAPHEIPK